MTPLAIFSWIASTIGQSERALNHPFFRVGPLTQADAAVLKTTDEKVERPGAAAQWRQLSLVRSNDVLHDRVRPPRQQPKHSRHEASGPPAGGGAGKKPRTDENKEPASRIRVPRALLEGRGDGAFIRLGDAMTATPEQHVHNFFAAHGKLGGAFLCANGAPCMVMDARMLRALDVQTKAMGQYIAQCGDDADPTRADTLVNMIAAEGLRVDLLAAVPGSALLEDTHGFSGLAIFDIDVHDNSPAGSVSFTLGGAAIAATLANERDAAADAMEAAPWASCDAYGGTQFNSVTIRRWASVKYIHVPKYYHISSWPPCVPTAPSTNKQLLSSPPRRAYQ